MSRAPTVSVVVPLHNGAATISRSIRSALRQRGADLEVIVVDDGSTDHSAEVVRRWAVADPRVRVIGRETASGGPATPRNAAIASSRARWIALLDHDDEWSSADKLARQLGRLDATHAAVCYSRAVVREGRFRSVDYHQRFCSTIGPAPYDLPEARIVDHLTAENVIPALTAVFAKDLWERLNGFDERWPGIDDYHFWLRAAEAGDMFCAVNAPLATYRWNASNLSHVPQRDHHRLLAEMRADLGWTQ